MTREGMREGPALAMEEDKQEHRVSFEMMLLDAKFTDAPATAPCTPPTIQLYGVTQKGLSICCYIEDFLPYFWFPSPKGSSKLEEIGEESFKKIRDTLNNRMLASRRKYGTDNYVVANITSAYKTPLMYYRHGGPSLFLKVEVWRSKDVHAAAKELAVLAEGKCLEQYGLLWNDWTSYEDDIKLGMRFNCDTCIAGGSWVKINCGMPVHHSHQKTRCAEEYLISWHDVTGLTPDATSYMEFSPAHAGVSGCCMNSQQHGVCIHDPVEKGSSAEACVTGLKHISASNNAGSSRNMKSEVGTGLEQSQWLLLSPLRCIALHVQCAGGGSSIGSLAHTSVPCKLKRKGKESRREIVKSNHLRNVELNSEDKETGDIENLLSISVGESWLPSRDPVLVISNLIFTLGDQEVPRRVVFIHGKGIGVGKLPGVELHIFDTEIAMLAAWQEFFHSEVDPDVICLYQLKDSIRYVVERLKGLKLGTLDISRCKGQATQVKSVVSYGKNWVKQQARMTATSNQEVFRATVEGRIVIDMLRIVLVAYNLSTFTLGECSQVFLGKPKEVLNSEMVTELWKGKYGGCYRLIGYCLHEAEVSWRLMRKLQTVPETIELARVTGLTISDVLYKAQMVRVQSLLLRSACREGWLLGGPTINGQLSESPYLIHPRESKTSGFYKDPVVILDFASLYPSIYMAYNLCYTTLVHPKDVNSFSPDLLITSQTGACFVVPTVRRGVLPRICGALIAARKLARDKMNAEGIEAEELAVLDGRQKALKVCANALYGFTGAGASPQQALPLADSCLSMGAASCKQAVELVENTFDTAKVVYAQTDSVFIKFHGATAEEAIVLGNKAADFVSKAFPSPMVLKFEKVLCPFLLLQVNRYAGKDVTHVRTEKDQGTLFVRGIEAERRDVPLFVRTVCKSALHEILVNGNVSRALEVSKHEIQRLVSGRCSMFELVMTGGLWRVDDHDISRLASATKIPQKDTSGHSTAEEGRGPHVALAVKLKRKDPSRQFHIGERIPYVLVANTSKLQDEMAEHPINAIRENMQPNIHVYLENKLRKPLESILENVTESSQLRDLFTGIHTLTPVSTSSSIRHGTQALVSRFFKPKLPCLCCRKPLVDENAPLCKDCINSGASQCTTALILSEKMELEKRCSRGLVECLRCHSGGSFMPILCTNADCPVFYCRFEAILPLQETETSLIKLQQFA